MVFGADLIAGFPTETEDMFQRSLDLVANAAYSPARVSVLAAAGHAGGAHAAARPRVVKERARRLRERGVLALRAHLDAEVGARRRVLAETHERGRTEQFTPVKLFMRAAPGTIFDLRMAGHDGRQLLAG